MNKNIKIYLVLGLPCTGKTTLSRKLAQAIEADHISIGNLIRDYFMINKAEGKKHSLAFRGEQVFDEQLIINLLNTALDHRKCDEVVIDAGPPFDKVTEKMNLCIAAVFFIHTSDQKRIKNFSEREKKNERYDDDMSLYHSRSSLYKKELVKLHDYFQEKVDVFDLDGTGDKESVLSQALSYILLNDLESNKIYPRNSSENIDSNTNISEIVDFLIASSAKYREPTYYLNKKAKGLTDNNMLLLFKPCLDYPHSIYEYVYKKIQEYGYEIQGLVCWDKDSLLKSEVFKAHFDLHYIHAKWGEFLIPSEQNEKKKMISAYRYSEDISLIDKIWNDPGNKPLKLKHSFWIMETKQETIINGHIPSLIRDFEENSSYLIAFHISAKDDKSMNWEFMREHFLGSTDPLKANSESLRREAAEGKLGIVGDISFRNNAFHLSAGPFEGYREIRVWFGKKYLEHISIDNYRSGVVDRPLEQMGTTYNTLYQETQNVDSNSLLLHSMLEIVKEKYKIE